MSSKFNFKFLNVLAYSVRNDMKRSYGFLKIKKKCYEKYHSLGARNEAPPIWKGGELIP